MSAANRPDETAEERALARMAPIISHELRNPLAVIGNSAYFLKTKLSALGERDPKVPKHLGIIEAEVGRANALIGEIVAFARLDEPVKSSLRLNALAGEAVKGLADDAPGRLALELSPDDPRVAADPGLLGAAIRHLARNGIEALGSSAGGRVSVRTGREGKTVFVEVADDGPGVAAEVLKDLFVPFTTNKPRGLGLGLAFARKVALKHGGTLEGGNQPGQGAKFKLSLPAD